MDAVTGVHRALLKGTEKRSAVLLADQRGIDLPLDRLSEVGALYLGQRHGAYAFWEEPI